MSQVEADELSPLVRLLQQFNRKERYWLLADALGDPFRALDASYRERLGKVLKRKIPANAWWALDYHYDWLHAALCCAPDYRPKLGVERVNEQDASGRKKIRGTQEDVDLIIAFGQTIILIEAKGVTGWTNGQMESKTQRLIGLSYDSKQTEILLVLTSPLNSERLGKGEWVADVPSQMMPGDGTYYHLPMHGLGGGADLLRVERCQEGKAAHNGEFWRIVEQKKFALP